MKEELFLLTELPIPHYTLKKPVEVKIERIGRWKFVGRFKNLPLVIKVEGGTRRSIIRRLGEGLIVQYVEAADSTGTLHSKIREACEAVLEPAA